MKIIKRMKIFTIIVAALLLSTTCNAEIIDGLAARVGDRVITIKEVITEYQIASILKKGKRSVDIPPAAPFRRDILDQIINRELIYREAANVKSFSARVDIFDEMLGFEEKFTYSEQFSRFMSREGLTADDLADRFLKIKAGSSYLAEKLPHMVSVSLKEVEDYYYREEKGEFSGKKFEDVKGEIREHLLKSKGASALDKWLSGLRKRANILYFKLPPLEPPP